jgi:hypothetical protein
VNDGPPTNVCSQAFEAPYLGWLEKPYFEWWSSPDALHRLEAATGGPWWLIGGAALTMFAAWTVCYVVIFIKCWREKTYGFPIANVALNLGWETVFAFRLLGPLPRFYFPLQWGHLLWVTIDLANVFLIVKFGRARQNSAVTRRFFGLVVIGGFALAMPASFMFMRYTGDVMGVASAMIIDVVMAALFLSLYANRADLNGLSYAGAWLRLVGDVASFIFLYRWWPAQFANGAFATCDVYAYVPEPRTYAFLNAMYVASTILTLVYIGLLASRRRQRTSSAATPAQV